MYAYILYGSYVLKVLVLYIVSCFIPLTDDEQAQQGIGTLHTAYWLHTACKLLTGNYEVQTRILRVVVGTFLFTL